MKALVKVFTAIVLVGVMGLVSCQQPEKATIYLKVVNSGNPVPEVAVGMYQLINIADTIQPHGRYNAVVTTDNEGVAEFVISRMDIGENGVYCVFETKDELGNINGSVFAFVSRGCNKMPLTLKQK